MRTIRKRRVRLGILSVFGLIIIFLLCQNLIYTETKSIPLALFNLGNGPRFNIEVPDTNISRDIYLNLKSAIAIDNKTQEILYCYNASEVRPVASISKLLTAMVVLDNFRPDSLMEVTRADARRSSRSISRVGDKVNVRDLLHAALLQSDNRAARVLARSVTEDRTEFALKMNVKARTLGLYDTEMFEPTGLSEKNRSTAADCARLVNLAVQYPLIAKITSLKKYEFTIKKRNNRTRRLRLINTNRMVFSKYRVLAGKTGYIIKSDYCLSTILENGSGDLITIVVLGAPGPKTRFREARRLANYAFRKIDRHRYSSR
jgi:D-alanyl-D-alanine endopeptidase (penicillin-binding protein 7)